MGCTCIPFLSKSINKKKDDIPQSRNSAEAWPTAASNHVTADELHFQNVAALLKDVTGLRGTSLQQLESTAAILCRKLKADLLSVSAVSYTSASYVTLVAEGRSSCRVPLCVPQELPSGAAACASTASSCISAVIGAAGPVVQTPQSNTLPLDWKMLAQTDGLAWFAAVPMWRDMEVVGVLSVAFATPPPGFGTSQWLGAVEVLAAWCSQLIRDGQLTWMASFLEELSMAKDVNRMVKTLGRGLVQLVEMQVHVTLLSRVALVREEGDSALVFTEDGASSRHNSEVFLRGRPSNSFDRRTTLKPTCSSNQLDHEASASCGPGLASPTVSATAGSLTSTSPSHASTARHRTCVPLSNDAQVLGHNLPLTRTILAECLLQRKGIWIPDCTSFLQVPSNPGNDIFLSSSSQAVVSMVVASMPPNSPHTPLLAAYLTSSQALGAPLMQVVLQLLEEGLAVVAPLVSAKLQGDIAEEWVLLHSTALRPCAQPTTPMRQSRTSSVGAGPSRVDACGSELACSMDGGASAASPAGPPGSRRAGKSQSFALVESGAGNRNMGPLIAGLQDKLRSYTLLQNQRFNRPEDLLALELLERVGMGGFGTVYYGICSGLEVAVKLIVERDNSHQAWRDALELAVMSTISHPNIVQVLTYFTDVLLVPKTPRAVDRPSFGFKVPVEGDEVPEGTAQGLLICMEYCDKGSLAEAIKSNLFRERLPGGYGAMRPKMSTILHTLLEVALALRHLHGLQLVHCDLKPANVLLKTSATDPRGFTSKLSDFGLVKIINLPEEEAMLQGAPRRHQFSGTVTHSPPEAFMSGGVISFNYDIYAFGIIMWEMFTTAPVYLGMSMADIRRRVVEDNLRPDFPPWVPPGYQQLSEQCWAVNPEDRPSSEELVQAVKDLLAGQPAEDLNKRVRRHSSYLPHASSTQHTRTISHQRHTRSLSDSSQFPLHIL